MFGFDWPELIIIGIVALIFIGPEDLPDMFRQLGRFTAKLRQMSREFSRAMDQAAKDTGVSDVARDLKTSTSMKSMGLDKVREAADKFEKWDPIKNAAKPSMTSAATMPARALMPPPMPATPAASSLTSAAERDAAMSNPDEEVDDDLAAVAEADAVAAPITPNPAPTIHGPATQALYDKQALRAKVLAEQTEKLKAIEAGTYIGEPAAVSATPASATPASATPVVATPEPAPRKRTTKVKAETLKATVENPKADAPKKTSRKKKADNA